MLNDALEFPSVISRSRFLQRAVTAPDATPEQVIAFANAHADEMAARYESGIKRQAQALASGYIATRDLMEEARHRGNDSESTVRCQSAATAGDHILTTEYFANGYFSVTQAIELDALRFAIDRLAPETKSSPPSTTLAADRDVLLAAWVATASKVINSPGHTAQFLKSRNSTGFERVRASWTRSVFDNFERSLTLVNGLGRADWRAGNRVCHADTLDLPLEVKNGLLTAVIYADPPYSRDQYSRLYHVLETLIKYDYPESRGIGRARPDRHDSRFSRITTVREAFTELADLAMSTSERLVLSYPSSGLISHEALMDILGRAGRAKVLAEVPHTHSTLGGSSGEAGIEVIERLYLLTTAH